MPRIRRIQIKNFRSIKNLDIEVEDLAIFVGDNDSGKSNILRALNLFFNDRVEPDEPYNFGRDFNKYVGTNRTAKQFEITLTFELPENYHSNNGERAVWKKAWRIDGLQNLRDWHGLQQGTTRRGRRTWTRKEFSPRSKVPPLLSRVEFEYVPAIRGRDFFRTLRGRIYRAISEVSEQSFRDSSSDFERAIGDNVTPLINDISDEIQDSTQLKLPNDLSHIFESLDFLSGDKSISLDHRGDGIKGRYVPLILKFIADKKSSLLERGGTPYTFIWAYEEPENNLEMRRAKETADLFCRLAAGNTTQVLLTTHSPIFFNIEGSESLTVSTSFVSKLNNEDGSMVQSSAPSNRDLDERMGVMPIVAPHIAKAMSQLEEADKERKQLQGIIDEISVITSTIYVEGESDFIVLQALLQAMAPSEDTPICIEQPPIRAGANYVANMLRAWECKTKHMNGDRKKAIGIIDCDDEGDRAYATFAKEFKNPRHVKLWQLPRTPIISNAYDAGLSFPNCLEEQFPREWWEHARDQNWLEERNRDEVTSKAALIEIAHGRTTLPELFEGNDWELHATYCIRNENKVEFANWVAARGQQALCNGLASLADKLGRECQAMGIEFVP